MINEKNLKNYILKNFTITLVLVSIFQLANNYIFINLINPILSYILDEDFSAVLGFSELLIFFIMLFLSLVLSPSTTLSAGRFLANLLGVNVTEQIFSITQNYFEDINNLKGMVVALIIIFCWIVIFVIWILPYVIGAIIFTRSVSKKVKELERMRIEKAKEDERRKNLLLSDIAHDIKTPITTIAGFSQALCEEQIETNKQKEYLNAINVKSLQTVDMITLLFEYVKLDSEGYELTKTTEDICEVFRGCVANYYTDFENKRMELDINIPEEGIFMQIDRLQMQRVFNNILVNALKHNPEGTKIYLSVELLEKWVSIKVSDNGTWIESEIARYIFDPYVQGDKSRTGGRGTGLGLSITRKIVEMHSGRIRLMQYKSRTPLVKTFEIQLKREEQ